MEGLLTVALHRDAHGLISLTRQRRWGTRKRTQWFSWIPRTDGATVLDARERVSLLRREGNKNSTRSQSRVFIPAAFWQTSLSCYVDMWRCMTVMQTTGRAQRHLFASALLHTVNDGCAIDRATEIIKCCPSGSSIRRWQWQEEAVVGVQTHVGTLHIHTQPDTRTDGSSSSPLSDSQPVKDMELALIFSFIGSISVLVPFYSKCLASCVCVCESEQIWGEIIWLLRECVISVMGSVTGQVTHVLLGEPFIK